MQDIRFSGTVNITQIGHAVLHLDEFDEDYLIPLPDVKVQGILSGSPYPELQGSHSIISSNGYKAVVDFSGKRLLGIAGQKNHVHAEVFAPNDNNHKKPIYVAEGNWSESFEIKDASGHSIDSYSVANAKPTEFRTLSLGKQDPWESRKAWSGVIEALKEGNMQGVADAKNALENAQRELRKHPETDEKSWKTLFFKKGHQYAVAEKLLAQVGKTLDVESTCGVWSFDPETAKQSKRPYRGDLTPYG